MLNNEKLVQSSMSKETAVAEFTAAHAPHPITLDNLTVPLVSEHRTSALGSAPTVIPGKTNASCLKHFGSNLKGIICYQMWYFSVHTRFSALQET